MSTDSDRIEALLLGGAEPAAEELGTLLPFLQKRMARLPGKKQLRAIELAAREKSGAGLAFLESLQARHDLAIRVHLALLLALRDFGREVDQAALDELKRWSEVGNQPKEEFPLEAFAALSAPRKDLVIALLFEEKRGDVLLWLEDRVEDKAAAKAIKKAVHKLRSSGVEVETPREAHHYVIQVEQQKELAFTSPLDSAGERLVLLHRHMAGGNHFFYVLRREGAGLVGFDDYLLGRGQFLKAVDDMRKSNPLIGIIEVPPEFARRLIYQAEEQNWKSSTPLPEHYGTTRINIGPKPDLSAPHPLLSLLNLEEVRANSGLVYRSPELLTNPTFQICMFDHEIVHQCKDKLDSANASLLVLSDEQKTARDEEIIQESAKEAVDKSGKETWQNRLQESAYLLQLTGNTDLARIALATSLALEGDGPLPPFFGELMRHELLVHYPDNKIKSPWQERKSGLLVRSEE